MCSILIRLTGSCYTDNFSNILNVYATALIMGIIIGTAVGILLLFIKNKH